MKKINGLNGNIIAINTFANQQFEKYQLNHSKQNIPTPAIVTANMLTDLDVNGKSVVVVSNFDMYATIKRLNEVLNLGIRELKLVTDVKLNFESDNIIYVESLKDFDLKQFDAGLLNPPYVEGAQQIGWKIARRVMQQCQQTAVILPNNQLLKLAENISGFQKAVECAEYFKCNASIKNGLSYAVFNKSLPTQSFESILGHNMPIYDYSLRTIIKKSHPLTPKKIELIQTHGAINAIKSTTNYYSINPDIVESLDDNFNTYRVAVNLLGGHPITRRNQIKQGKKVTTSSTGKAVIVNPGTAIIGDMRYFVCRDLNEALKLADYVNSVEVQNIMAFAKMQQINAEQYWQYVPVPDFLK